MNTQNIAALTEQLQLLGFKNLGYALMNRVCFRPERFSLVQKIVHGKDSLSFQILFEKTSKKDMYILVYYDAILQKDIAIADMTVNGINTTFLAEQMAGIDWKNAFKSDEINDWSAKDEATWHTEQIIEKIVEDLISLKKMEETKEIALSLMHKYWGDIHYLDLIGPVTPLKSRPEISQRFYLHEEQKGITVDEAYRFLQNKWLEKQLLTKKKQLENTNGVESQDSSSASFNNEVSRKQGLEGSRGTKNNKFKTVK